MQICEKGHYKLTQSCARCDGFALEALQKRLVGHNLVGHSGKASARVGLFKVGDNVFPLNLLDFMNGFEPGETYPEYTVVYRSGNKWRITSGQPVPPIDEYRLFTDKEKAHAYHRTNRDLLSGC